MGFKSRNIGWTFLQCTFIWLTVVPIGISIIIVPFFLFFLYHLIITRILKKIFRPDLLSPVTSIDFAFSSDNFHGNPRGPIGLTVVVDGILDVEEVLDRYSFLTESRNSCVDYTRLTTIYPSFWLGYPFWTRVNQEFDVRKHLKVIENGNAENELKKWFKGPFAQRQPLWDALLVPGYTDDGGNVKSLFALRIHHLIGDGITVRHLLRLDPTEDAPKIEYFDVPKPSLLYRISTIFWAPLVMWQEIYASMLIKDALTDRDRGNDDIRFNVNIPLGYLKALRRRATSKLGKNVSFSNVIFLCLTGALRRVFLEDLKDEPNSMSQMQRGINISPTGPRQSVHPLMSRFPAVCNHWGFSIINLPLSEPEALDRLKNLVDQEKWLLISNSYETNLILPQYCYPIFPSWLFSKMIASIGGVSSGFANIPPVLHSSPFCGKALIKAVPRLGLQTKQTGMTFTCFTLQHNVVLSAGINENVFPRIVATSKIPEYVMAELKELLQYFDDVDERSQNDKVK